MSKRGPKPGRRKAPTTTAPLAILGDYTPKQIEQIRQAVLDRATGRRIWFKLRRQGNTSAGQQLWVVVDESEAAEWSGYVYTMDSDPQALKMVVEHFEGRPATKENAPIDPIVNVLLTVPGKRTVFTCPGCGLKTVGDPNDARPTDGVGEPVQDAGSSGNETTPPGDEPGVAGPSSAGGGPAPCYEFEPARDIADELVFGDG
jgi:hypothetical protein